MKYLILNESPNSPGIHWISAQNTFRISGNSMLPRAGSFYDPLIHLVDEHHFDGSKDNLVEFYFREMNEESKAAVLNLCTHLGQKLRKLKKSRIVWYCDQKHPEVRKLGQKLKRGMKSIQFSIVEV